MAWPAWAIGWYAGGMVDIATFNVIALTVVLCRAKKTNDRTSTYLRRQRCLSSVFVVVCAFRAYLPTIYLARACLVDSAFSNILAARLLASVAEPCFILQLSYAIAVTNGDVCAELSQQVPNWKPNPALTTVLHIAVRGMPLLICCAEVFSCLGTLLLMATDGRKLWIAVCHRHDHGPF
jgi:hypothetical protein